MPVGYHEPWIAPAGLKPEQIGWLAGVFDGEGCISIGKQKPGSGGRVNPSYRLTIKVTMGHEIAIRRIHELLRVGSVHPQNSRRRSDGVPFNPAWAWWCAANEASAVLRFLQPHLIVKSPEVIVALEFAALPRFHTGGARGNQRMPPEMVALREDYFCWMRDLKPSARFRRKEVAGAQAGV